MNSSQAAALIATLIVESLVVCLAKRHFDNISTKDILQCVIGLNLITHPLAWTAVSVSGIDHGVVELLVCAFEAIGLRLLLLPSNFLAVMISILANLASMAVYWLVAFAI